MTNTLKHTILFAGFVGFIGLGTGCEKTPSTPTINESELITTLQVTFISDDATSKDTVILKFQDLDGDGGNAPVLTKSKAFIKDKTYNATLILSDESKTPADNITEEIEEEKEAHQFFFSATSNLFSSITYSDKDANNQPVGLAFAVKTNATAVTGATFTVTLRHQPTKSATGVSQGDITNAGGETDIEVQFTGLSSQ